LIHTPTNEADMSVSLPSNTPDGAETEDYCGIPFEEWKEMIRKDVEKNFGPIPLRLVSAGEAGW
jgi:hypothetical protein